MRCAECGYYECCMRTSLGGCTGWNYLERIKEKYKTEIEKYDKRQNDMEKAIKAILFLTERSWSCIAPGGIDPIALKKAASDLADAVERYVKQGCLRSELLNKKNALKKLL